MFNLLAFRFLEIARRSCNLLLGHCNAELILLLKHSYPCMSMKHCRVTRLILNWLLPNIFRLRVYESVAPKDL
jgi:hypothetical protein